MSAGAATLALPKRPETILEGDLVARFSLETVPASARFLVTATVGNLLLGNELAHAPEHDAWTAPVSPAVKVTMGHTYIGLGGPSVLSSLFAKGDIMLLKGLLADPAEVDDAVSELTDNQQFEAANGSWWVTVVGMAGIHAVHNRLCAVGSSKEAGGVRRPPTNPETRASTVVYASRYALGTYLLAQPQ